MSRVLIFSFFFPICLIYSCSDEHSDKVCFLTNNAKRTWDLKAVKRKQDKDRIVLKSPKSSIVFTRSGGYYEYSYSENEPYLSDINSDNILEHKWKLKNNDLILNSNRLRIVLLTKDSLIMDSYGDIYEYVSRR